MYISKQCHAENVSFVRLGVDALENLPRNVYGIVRGRASMESVQSQLQVRILGVGPEKRNLASACDKFRYTPGAQRALILLLP